MMDWISFLSSIKQPAATTTTTTKRCLVENSYHKKKKRYYYWLGTRNRAVIDGQVSFWSVYLHLVNVDVVLIGERATG